MGYTHYWYLKKGTPKLSEKCIDDVKKVIKKYKDIIQFESENEGKPLISTTLIRFNGIGKDAHETFYFEVPPVEDEILKFRDSFLFSFCKTASKPYDIVVCELLLILKAELKENIKLNSDGFSSCNLSFDGEWDKAINEVKKMGYKINAIVYSRDNGNSPYFDCEIKSINRVD